MKEIWLDEVLKKLDLEESSIIILSDGETWDTITGVKIVTGTQGEIEALVDELS